MTVTNLNEFKENKKVDFIKCIKCQIISDYRLTPRDLTPDVVYEINKFSEQIYKFHLFMEERGN